MPQTTYTNNTNCLSGTNAVPLQRSKGGNATTKHRRSLLAGQLFRDLDSEVRVSSPHGRISALRCVSILELLAVRGDEIVGTMILISLSTVVASGLQTTEALSTHADTISDGEMIHILAHPGDFAYNLMSDNDWVGCGTPVAA